MQDRNEDGLTEAEFLEHYQPGDYERPSVSVDTLIFTIDEGKLEVLLIKRRNHPYINHWAIPGGFVDIDESVDDAAKRELEEETGLRGIYLEQLYTWGEVKRDPRMRVISVSYMALLPKDDLHPVAGDDAGDVRWFQIQYNDEILQLQTKDGSQVLTKDHLAFDHYKIIKLAIERMRGKIDYTPIAFKLLPQKFTLGELQYVYEAILGKKLHKSNFRRRIIARVESTDELCRGKSGRPGQYYVMKDGGVL